DFHVTGVQTCALPISRLPLRAAWCSIFPTGVRRHECEPPPVLAYLGRSRRRGFLGIDRPTARDRPQRERNHRGGRDGRERTRHEIGRASRRERWEGAG